MRDVLRTNQFPKTLIWPEIYSKEVKSINKIASHTLRTKLMFLFD